METQTPTYSDRIPERWLHEPFLQRMTLCVDNGCLSMAAEGGLLLQRSAKGLVPGYRVAGDPCRKALAASFGVEAAP